MRCKHCKDKFIAKYFNQKYCMVKDDCIKAFVEQCKIENNKKVVKQMQVEKKQLKDNLKKHGDWLGDLELLINLIARLIDKELPCISCGGNGKPQAGHYSSVGSFSTLRYNLHNIHIQDYVCNVHKSANIAGYDDGLIRWYGNEYWEYVKFGLKNKYYHPLKLSIIDIKEKLIVCREIVNELKKSEPLIDGKTRISARDYLNTRIGIYTEPYL